MRQLLTQYTGCLPLGILLVGLPARAQNLTINNASLSPARNAKAANVSASVSVPFSQAINAATAGNIKIFSQQYGGQRTVTPAVSGNTATLAVGAAFKPGETVFVTVPNTVQSTTGASATPQVYQFTTAVARSAGSFASGSNVPLNVTPVGAVLGDVDGDGDLDVLTADYSNSGTVGLLLNDGNGNFISGPAVLVNVESASSIKLGDVDGDGDLDLLVANPGYSGSLNTVSIRLNNGTGSFSGATEVAVEPGPASLIVGDVNGDGRLDFVTANSVSLCVRLNNGGGSFSGSTYRPNSNAGITIRNLTAGDVDGDGDLDLVSASRASFEADIWLNDGTGGFAFSSAVTTPGLVGEAALGDLDGDGDLDLLTANGPVPNSGGGASGTLGVRLNNGNGVFAGTVNVPVFGPAIKLSVGDVDGDGDLDALVAASCCAVSVKINDGMGDFSGSGTGPSPANSINGLAMGDLDGDGDLDYVLTSTQSNTAHTMSVGFNSAAGPLASANKLTTNRIMLYPNPAHAAGNVQVAYAVAMNDKAAQATVLNALGQVVATATLPIVAGQATGALPTAGLASGIYLVRLQAGAMVATQRLVLQ